jgi:hypothetical protein
MFPGRKILRMLLLGLAGVLSFQPAGIVSAVPSRTESFSPAVEPSLAWNTFLGGSGVDYGFTIAADGNGNLYATGRSDSSWGSPIRAHSGGFDIFVAKLDSSGNLIWNTFLGGTGEDYGSAVAVDGSGNVYVACHSDLSWGSPIRAFTGVYDACAAKLNPSGALIWNTFLGGGGVDMGFSITADGVGNAYLSGASTAAWGSPLHPYASGYDAFIAKLNTSGSLTWHTFLGGSGYDSAWGIGLDGSGNVYASGMSDGGWGTPVRAYTGGGDGFAAKLDSAGGLTWNTFLGGSDLDSVDSVIVDGSGNVYVAGFSSSAWGSPVHAYTGSADVMAARMDSSGNLVWHTFLGGSAEDYGNGLSLDGGGNINLTGDSESTWGNPVRPYSGGIDSFGAKLNPSGTLIRNTFLGGGGDDRSSGTAMDGNGDIYMAGFSSLAWGSPVRAYIGNQDAFAAKLVLDEPGAFGKSAPADGSATNSSPILSWEESRNADYYIYCVDTVDNGVCDSSWEYAGTDTSAVLSGLDPDETYYWFVAASNSIGTTYADGGTWWSFTTLPDPPAAFGKTTPADGGYAPFDPTLTWEAAAGADEYEYCLDTTDNSTCDGSWTSTGTLTEDGVTGLPNNTTYYWQVRASNAGGETHADGGAWWSFRTPTFADVPYDHPLWQYIEAFYAEGITTGCGVSPLIYCPESVVTRAAMAVFLLRAKYGAGYAPPPATHTFADLPVAGKEWQEAWVDQFYLEGITTGCGTGPLIYCPENPVTRAAMAVFILRAIEGPSYTPPPASHFFADLPVAGKEWMEPWVDEFYRRGITTGCGTGPLIYCPEDAVKRQAMAAFIVRAFSIPLP